MNVNVAESTTRRGWNGDTNRVLEFYTAESTWWILAVPGVLIAIIQMRTMQPCLLDGLLCSKLLWKHCFGNCIVFVFHCSCFGCQWIALLRYGHHCSSSGFTKVSPEVDSSHVASRLRRINSYPPSPPERRRHYL
jgi:hypothetical protein